jgi:hypothetical protein
LIRHERSANVHFQHTIEIIERVALREPANDCGTDTARPSGYENDLTAKWAERIEPEADAISERRLQRLRAAKKSRLQP